VGESVKSREPQRPADGICLAGRGTVKKRRISGARRGVGHYRLPASRRWFCTGSIRLPPKTTSPEADARARAVAADQRQSRPGAPAEAWTDSAQPNTTDTDPCDVLTNRASRAPSPMDFSFTIDWVRARVSCFPHSCCVTPMVSNLSQICCTAAASG
jgi:hypothetical protein